MEYEGMRKVVCSKWALEILEALLGDGPLNYSDLEAILDASSDTLTNRLELLESKGLIERRESSPKDVSYQITSEGERFLTDIQELEASYGF